MEIDLKINLIFCVNKFQMFYLTRENEFVFLYFPYIEAQKKISITSRTFHRNTYEQNNVIQ